MKKMKKFADALFVLCFAAALVAVGLLTLGNRNETFSYYENRSLAPKPVLTKEGVLDGSYFSQWDSYWMDRAVGRTAALKYDTLWQWKVLHKPVVHDIVITEKSLLPYLKDKGFEPKPPVEKLAGETGDELAALDRHIRDNGGTFFYVGVPSQITYFKERYPDFLDNQADYRREVRTAFREALTDRGVAFLDMVEAFEQAGNPPEYYWSTDHHCNLDGGLFVYRHIMEAVNQATGRDLKILREEDIRRITLPNRFSGSRNKPLYLMYPNEDRLTYAELVQPIPFTREDNGVESPATVNILPPEDALVSYGVFMGNDYAETIIRTDRPELPKLLVFGDSYTNVLETLLYASFDETRSLDLRHYNEKTLWEYIEEYQPDVVIDVRDDGMFLSPSPNGTFR